MIVWFNGTFRADRSHLGQPILSHSLTRNLTLSPESPGRPLGPRVTGFVGRRGDVYHSSKFHMALTVAPCCNARSWVSSASQTLYHALQHVHLVQ